MKKQGKPFTFRGKYLFLTVLCFYILFFLVNSQSAFLALQKSTTVLTRILPIIAVVIVFTALLNFFLQPKQMARHLGHESGIRGWFWSLLAGVISHGPMYAWYPLLEDLREHGMKDELIVVFFASRAIKIPLIPVMIDYFGLAFTFLLSFYMLFGALLQGIGMQWLQAKGVQQL